MFSTAICIFFVPNSRCLGSAIDRDTTLFALSLCLSLCRHGLMSAWASLLCAARLRRACPSVHWAGAEWRQRRSPSRAAAWARAPGRAAIRPASCVRGTRPPGCRVRISWPGWQQLEYAGRFGSEEERQPARESEDQPGHKRASSRYQTETWEAMP